MENLLHGYVSKSCFFKQSIMKGAPIANVGIGKAYFMLASSLSFKRHVRKKDVFFFLFFCFFYAFVMLCFFNFLFSSTLFSLPNEYEFQKTICTVGSINLARYINTIVRFWEGTSATNSFFSKTGLRNSVKFCLRK